MMSSMQFSNAGSCVAAATAPVNAQHNRFNPIKIGHRADKMGSVDKYAGINLADASATTMAKNYTKDNGHRGINNNNNNINHKNNNNTDSESVTYYLLKTLNNNNNIATLTNGKNPFGFGEENGKGCIASDQVKNDRFGTDGDESNESGTIDVVGADANRNGLDHPTSGNGLSGDEKAPDHHARRPMNAFLIFCKRHRAIVREKYPNLENRSITKILGDWWANLEKEEKVCYTDLAKQYKDAFFSANPNFKWYKLPAPPLRSISIQTRPDRHDSFSDPSYDDYDTMSPMSKISHGSIDTECDSNAQHKIKCEHAIKSSVGLFKLADETQMGGLNSLMMAVEMVHAKSPSSKLPINNEPRLKLDTNFVQDKLDEQDALHRELGETHSFIERTINGLADDIDVFSTVPYQSHIKQEQDSDKIIPIKNFTYAKSHGSPDKCYEFDSNEDEGSGGDTIASNTVKKSSRACKGKRYLEFMNARKYNPIVRKSKSRSTSTSSASLSPTEHPRNGKSISNATNSNASRKMDYDSFDHLYANHSATISLPATANKNAADVVTNGGGAKLMADASNELATNKFFDANDFDLEEKIKALPGRSLDKYLSRKRDTKKKKKINGKRSSNVGNRKNAASKNASAVATNKSPAMPTIAAVAPPKTIQEAKERLMMVGSQKRKARKESITRRDVKPIIAITESISSPQPPPLPSVASNHVTANNNPSNCAPDLLILATLAEAAANYSV